MSTVTGKSRRWPLYAAGFTTAFGAHGVAASIGNTGDVVPSLITLGALLAVYDLAEIVLKPVFGALADRVGARPVLLGGLFAFAAASAAYVVIGGGGPALWVVRMGQGIAASAFSPAASALVARLSDGAGHGRAFGGYGFFKSIGYTLGPLLGGLLVHLGGLRLLIGVMAVLAVLVGGWAAIAVPRVPTLPRRRQTLVDLARNLGRAGFLVPVGALALATAALSVGVGFLPVSGREAGLGTIATGAAVSLLAIASAVVQPLAGTALDRKRLPAKAMLVGGLLLLIAGLLAATQAQLAWLLVAAVLIGAGVGAITPVGFAVLAGSTPADRLGRTMGSAEVGRELGDAGGPLLVGAIAAAAGLTSGYLGLVVITLIGAVAVFAARSPLSRAG